MHLTHALKRSHAAAPCRAPKQQLQQSLQRQGRHPALPRHRSNSRHTISSSNSLRRCRRRNTLPWWLALGERARCQLGPSPLARQGLVAGLTRQQRRRQQRRAMAILM